MPSTKIDDDFYRHHCLQCNYTWHSKKENPKVCANVKNCSNRSRWNFKRRLCANCEGSL